MALMVWPMTSDGSGAVVYPASDWRTFLTVTYTEGVFGVGSFVVSQRALGANMRLDISAGISVVQGDDVSTQGRYLVREDAPSLEAVTISTAHGSLDRIDLVGIRINDPSAGGNAGRDATFVVVAGTAAGSPVAPALPASVQLLAEVSVPAGTVAITDALVTDRRAFAVLAHDVVGDANASRLGTRFPTADTIMRRDANGSSQVSEPTSFSAIANKGYVDAAGTGAASPNSIMRRDGAARAAIATPAADAHIANKGYVDATVDGLMATGGTLSNGATSVTYRRLAGMLFVGGQVGPDHPVTLPAGYRPAVGRTVAGAHAGGTVGPVTIADIGVVHQPTSSGVSLGFSWLGPLA